MDDRALITVSEAARRLDTYPNAINRWIAKGELEFSSFSVLQAVDESQFSLALLLSSSHDHKALLIGEIREARG